MLALSISTVDVTRVLPVKPRSTGISRSRTSTKVKSLKTGIVGLPNVGKSTLFNALVENGAAQAANYPFCTIEPNIGIVPVPDERLSKLAEISNSANKVPAVIEFVDIAGLVKGAANGQGLGNKFLSNIRECDAVIHVVRCFDDIDVIHVEGKVDPSNDVAVINFELALSDLSQVERRLEKLKRARPSEPEQLKENEIERSILDRVSNGLIEGVGIRNMGFSESELEILSELNLLTAKPFIYAANVSEADLARMMEGEENEYVTSLRNTVSSLGGSVCVVSAQLESELIQLDTDERKLFMEELGVKSSGLSNMIKEAYKQLDLLTYYTTGEKETRAWTIKKGYSAPQAAGVIHTDFERGFIKAETVSCDNFILYNGFQKVKEKGLYRLEGKDYIVEDGDIMIFKFNV
jgi:obg-like ATPase 1